MKVWQQLILGLFLLGGLLSFVAFMGIYHSMDIAEPLPVARIVPIMAALIGFVTIYLLMAKSITATIGSLVTAVGEFGKGNLQYRINSQQQDELGDLARAFDRMGEELERSAQQIAQEISERERAETTALEARLYLESALTQSPSGILIADAVDLKVRFANQAALDLCGLEEDQLSDSDLTFLAENSKLVLPSGAPCPPQLHPLTRALELGETVKEEDFSVRDAEGAVHWVSASSAPLYNNEGEIIAAAMVLHDVTERRQMLQRLEEIAFHDPLTGLANRTSILDTMQNSIDRRSGNHYALLFLDFDRFKLINDSLGHDVGDELLREIGNRICGAIRGCDEVIIPARLGGDEFVVWLDNLACVEDAAAIAERLLHVLSQSYDLGGQTICSTASFGVVTSEHQYDSALDMLRDADLAMYKSKADGKARYTVFDNGLRDQVQDRLQLENDMRAGISRGEFFLEFQPIVSLETGQVEGAEALARWMHPQKGKIGAEEFISIAEETGMIVPIGDRIVSEACRHLALWRNLLPATERPLCIHVNVSRLQLLLPDLVNVVERAMAEYEIQPGCLHLEVTESTIIDDLDRVISRLHELRCLGVKIDIDDFGTGYSSLSCLHQFPIDYLKLDRSFIANVSDSPDLAALLTAVLTLAYQLDLKVVAEGIEKPDQLEKLRELGCHYGQGYFFDKARTSEDFINFVDATRRMSSKICEALD
jgi:diguanylate cyclase (GGDEF)-like protein/PAS domain S-box-containing protein